MFEIAVVTALMACLALIAVLLHKVRRTHIAAIELVDKTRELHLESRNLYGQIQAYMDLTKILELKMPLPQLRGWAASPDFLLIIARHALKQKPATIVECSCGASTLVLARCAQINGTGHVFSLEHDPKFAAITRQNLEDAGLGDWATVLDAPLQALPDHPNHRWYDVSALTDVEKIDMLVVDGPPTHVNRLARYPAAPVLKQRFSTPCDIFLDDADRDDEREMVQKWIAEFDNDSLTVKNLSVEKGCVYLAYRCQ